MTLLRSRRTKLSQPVELELKQCQNCGEHTSHLHSRRIWEAGETMLFCVRCDGEDNSGNCPYCDEVYDAAHPMETPFQTLHYHEAKPPAPAPDADQPVIPDTDCANCGHGRLRHDEQGYCLDCVCSLGYSPKCAAAPSAPASAAREWLVNLDRDMIIVRRPDRGCDHYDVQELCANLDAAEQTRQLRGELAERDRTLAIARQADNDVGREIAGLTQRAQAAEAERDKLRDALSDVLPVFNVLTDRAYKVVNGHALRQRVIDLLERRQT